MQKKWLEPLIHKALEHFAKKPVDIVNTVNIVKGRFSALYRLKTPYLKKEWTPIKTELENLKYYMPDYLATLGVDIGKASRSNTACPVCGKGNRTGCFHFYEDTQKANCFSCGFNGDLFDLIAVTEGKTNAEAIARARELYGNEPTRTYTPVKRDEETPTDYTAFILQAAENIDSCDYLNKRGISTETQKHFKIGYVSEWRHPSRVANGDYAPASERIIIPTSRHSYIARAVDPANQYPKLKAGKAELFNAKGLLSNKPCFVVEGEVDALSLLEIGANAVSIGSSNNTSLLIEYLKNNEPPKAPILLCMDSDDAGRQATAVLSDELEKLKIEYYVADILNGAKDPNEALVTNREAFILSVNKAVNKQAAEYKQTSAGERIDLFTDNIKASAQTPPISTGFYNLDYALDGGIIPALYVLGAISSLGKTTLALQIADQMATNGQDILIFSLEMSDFELMAKSISRLTYKYCNGKTQNAKTVRGILNGAAYSKYSKAELELIEYCKGVYCRYAKNIYIKQGNISNTTVSDIAEAIEKHISFTGNIPVIIIDYLQIIKPHNERATDKQSTDFNISMLKNICKKYNTPILGISSFNRDSYNSPVNMSAFKESGSLEYSADVLLALQPEGMKDGEAPKTKTENIKTVKTCKASKVRNIELVILKNRNGSTNKTINFTYNAMFNCFEEAAPSNTTPTTTGSITV